MMIKEVLQDEVASMKQGIVTILRTDFPQKSPSPIRRTLSADMSSKTWLSQNGFLQHKKEIKKDPQNPIWDSVLTTQKDDCSKGQQKSPSPPPYVRKRSSGSMSEKSLELCTESLGSETGSDSFSSFSYPPRCELEYRKEREEVHQHKFKEEYSNSREDFCVAKYRNAPVRPFPPPIRSISGDGGDSLRLQSHREDGRLVLEAVAAPPRNYFQARRGDGRLVLTLIRRHRKEESTPDSALLEETPKIEGGLKEEGEGDKDEVVGRQVRSLLSINGLVRVHKSSSPGNKNPTFMSSGKIRDVEKGMDNRGIHQITQSLPSLPPCTASHPFNAYEHLWRNKTTAMAAKSVNLKNCNNEAYVAKKYTNQDILATPRMLRGDKLVSIVPYLKGCRESKRSMLIWEPCYIATS